MLTASESNTSYSDTAQRLNAHIETVKKEVQLALK